MGMFDSVKKAARKTKLQGELLLVQRELESLQKKSGAELFTVLYDWEQQQLHLKYDDHQQREEQPLQQQREEEQEDAVLHVALPVPGLTIVYQAAREDIMDMVEKRQFKVEEMDVVECKLENTIPATTAKTKAQNATQWMSNTGSLAKLKTEIVHLEREINIRKQIFGVQVFNEIDFYSSNDDNESSCTTLKEQLEAYQQQQQANNNGDGSSSAKHQQQEQDDESLSPTAVKVAKPPPRRTDEDIFALLYRIKLAMDPIMERKRAKQQEIAALLLL